MSLDSAQVVNGLISFYKRKGADLSYLLGDPIFNKLPLEDRVNAIKLHAHEILEGTPAKLNSQERGLVFGEAGAAAMGTAIAGFGLAKTVLASPKYLDSIARNKAFAVMGGTALLSGVLGGALVGRFKADNLYQQRQSVRRELVNTARNPTTDNAIGALSAKPLYNHLSVSRENIVSKIIGKMDNLVSSNVSERIEKEFPYQYDAFRGVEHPLTKHFK